MDFSESTITTLKRTAGKLLDTDHLSVKTEPVASGASSRGYIRLTGPEGGSLIGVTGSIKEENESFIHIAEAFADGSVPLPKVLWRSEDSMLYITSDNGKRSLLDCIRHEDTEIVLRLSTEALEALADMQILGNNRIDFNRCYPVAAMDSAAVAWDLSYFKYCFLKPVLDDIDEPGLQADFDRLTESLTDPKIITGFQFRDFQSRNVIVDDEYNVTLIDFQGGRHGMLLYDAASFIWQARAGFDESMRRKLGDIYYGSLRRHYPDLRRDEYDRQMQLAVTFRQLQTLGAYGFRGLVQGKIPFMTSITTALDNVATRIESGDFDLYPVLKKTLIKARQIWKNAHPDINESGRLTVTVTSFSYRRGYPVDLSGNGGGFVFDCRWMHNPGRYQEYKPYTGLDEPVRRFLGEKGECDLFVTDALNMVESAIERYKRRGFTSLCVAFGCTGGQHRSVFCADRFVTELRKKFPDINVEVIHREQSHRI